MQRVFRGRGSLALALLLICGLLLSACATSTAADQHQAKTSSVWTPGTAGSSTTSTANATGDVPSGDWLRFGFDPARSGVNPYEQTLTARTVGSLHRLWHVHLPATADSSPVYLHNLHFTDGTTHSVLYLTTLDGRLLAIDAANGSLLWQRQPTGQRITNSSPVASADGKYVYSYGRDGYVHRYDATTGDEATGNGWPVQITRMPGSEKESSALNITTQRLYTTTSGYIGDAPPYQGHVVTAPLIPGPNNSTHVFNSLCADLSHLLVAADCRSEQSGIWARGGAVIDPVTGDIFVTTGNGPYTGDKGGHDWGDSVLELSPDGSTLLDAYTPTDQATLNANDTDLGGDAVGIVPTIPNGKLPYLAVQGGKDGILRLLNRQNLSGEGGPGHMGGEVQRVSLQGCGTFTQPLVWQHAGTIWVIVAGACGTDAFTLQTTSKGVTSLHRAWTNKVTTSSPVVAGGVLYAASNGKVQALNPTTGHVLWSSTQASAGGTIGTIHWESPIVVGGVLYIPDQDGYLSAYGR